MRIYLHLDSLRATKPGEFLLRFLYGGAITVLAWEIANHWGPVIGGLFLAFPGIFPAGVTLVEKHKLEREAAEHKDGKVSARHEASVEAAGASAGALGLAAFGFVLWKILPMHHFAPVLLLAGAAWFAISATMWRLREFI